MPSSKGPTDNRRAAARDPLSPQWEDCKVCGGDHWTKDHPPTHDTPEASLAAALPLWLVVPFHDSRSEIAAAILAALDGWTLVRKDGWKMVPEEDGDPYNPEAELTAAWATLSGDLDWAKAEIARLRAALDALGSDEFGHALHARFYGGVAQEHNQEANGEPMGDCYKCRIVRDFVREYVAALDPVPSEP